MRKPRSACQCEEMVEREVSQPFIPARWLEVCGCIRSAASILNEGVEIHEGRCLQSEGVIGSRL
jgi:hypothetical protein